MGLNKKLKKPRSLPYIHKDLFPHYYNNNHFLDYCHLAFNKIKKLNIRDLARIPGSFGLESYLKLTKKYGSLPKKCKDPRNVVARITKEFMAGAPMWRSPNLQYNVGAAVNVASAASYALSLDINIYNINSGLAGNALAAEISVAKILAHIGGINPSKSFGLFTFGGTATNLYALKIATRRAYPTSGLEGMPNNIRFLISEDAHFSHAVATDWLGVGTKNLLIAAANQDRTTNLKDAEIKLRNAIENGGVIAAIMLNGGTTYDHAVDDIPAFVKLRDQLVKEYSLNYIPHIHVDSVIGWAWLMFRNYNFKKNLLKIDVETLEKIYTQYNRIEKLSLADSWGVDFHKGVGACPIPCSIIMMNDKRNFLLLSKSGNSLTNTHQLATEFSFESPSDYTLETSRPGGAPLAALTSLHTLGQYGYQSHLANLITLTGLLHKLIGTKNDIAVCNSQSLGYVTMVRMYPPELANDRRKPTEFSKPLEGSSGFTKLTNTYMKAFFSWDNKTRMDHLRGTVYSYTSHYIYTPLGISVPAIKIYPVSPNLRKGHIYRTIETIFRQKTRFDTKIWPTLKATNKAHATT